MKNIFKYVIIVFVFQSCMMDRVDRREMKIINTSKTDIWWVRSKSGKLEMPELNDDIDSIKVDSLGTVGNFAPSWDRSILGCKDHKMTFFIIPVDSVKKYGWDSIYSKGIYSKKYQIDMDYLKKFNWTIVYPTQE